MRLRRFPGRLNLFQATMLDWRDLHPYNAVHAVQIGRPLERDALSGAIAGALARAGLTGLELDRAHNRYVWRGGPGQAPLEIIAPDADWKITLAHAFERQLNSGFPRTGPIVPFRFFAVPVAGTFFLGLAYDHFIAGGDSIVVLLNVIADRYAGRATTATSMRLYPHRHWRLFVRHPLQFVRGVARLPAMAASCRRTIRPQYRAIDDGRNGFTFFVLDAAQFAALRDAAKGWRVTLNDALLALMLMAQDAQLAGRDRSARRHELAVASIMNLRTAHGEDSHTTFGQFLSSFRVAHPVPAGISLQELAQDVHRATARIKREKLFLTTLFAMALDRAIGRFQTQEQRMRVYAKNFPVGAGMSSLNVNALWRTEDGSPAPLYVRGVPTGPLSPIVVAITTCGDTLCAGVSYRTTAVTAADIDKMRADILRRIDALK